MATKITREEYEKMFGTKPVFEESADINTNPSPIRITREEYDAKFGTTEEESGGIFGPAKEAWQGLKTTYGGGEEGIARKLASDISESSKDIQKGMEKGGIAGVPDVLKGFAKGALRTAGDVVEGVFAPVGALLHATGVNKIFEDIQKNVQKGEGLVGMISEKITDIPAVQQFVMTHPNADKDFTRAMNLVMSKAETGKIEPKTAIPRTVEQIKAGVETVKKVPEQIQTYRVNKASKAIEDEIFNIENSYVKSQKANTLAYKEGQPSRQRIAETDVLSGIVSEDGKITYASANNAAKNYLKLTVDGSEGIVRNLLKQEGQTVPIKMVAEYLLEKVYSSGLEGAALKSAVNGVKREVAGIKLRANGDKIPVDILHDAKINETSNINYGVDTTPTIKYRKAKASAYKELVENNSKVKISYGDKTYSVKDINEILGKYLGDAERIQNLGGKGVKGSKLGKYSAQISGNLVGGAAGAAIGGPIGMAIGTILGGETASFIKGKQMAATFGKPRGIFTEKNGVLTRAKLSYPDQILTAKVDIPKTKEIKNAESLIKKNVKDQTKAIKKGDFALVATLKEIYPVLVGKLKTAVSDYSKSLGSLNKQYKKTNTPNNSSIPKTVPQKAPVTQKLSTAQNFESFMKKQKVFSHQTNAKFDDFDVKFANKKDPAIWFFNGEAPANSSYKYTVNRYPNKDIKLIPESKLDKWMDKAPSDMEFYKYLESQGFDGINYGDSVQIFNPQKSLKTAEQLKAEFNKTNKLTEDVSKLYESAPEAKTYIDNLGDSLAKKYGGNVAKPELKNIERAVQKVNDEYAGDFTKLTDIARNTIVVEETNVTKVLNDILKKEKDNIVKSKVVTPDTDPLGYSGVNIKIKAPNGHIAEIQVNSPEMIFAKESAANAKVYLGEKKFNELKKKFDALKIKGGQGHIYYEQFRNLPWEEAAIGREHPIAKRSIAYYSKFR